MTPPQETLRTASPHVLLVDDNRNGLIVRKALLEEVGYKVSTAGSGEEAYVLFESACFDVVVTDYRMPRMNGVELIGKMRQHCPGARIILLSGFVEPLGLTEQTTGADLVLAKCSNEATQLVRGVKRLLNHSLTRKPPASQGTPSKPRTRASGR
jgi:CheY-like chemotaxis protein